MDCSSHLTSRNGPSGVITFTIAAALLCLGSNSRVQAQVETGVIEKPIPEEPVGTDKKAKPKPTNRNQTPFDPEPNPGETPDEKKSGGIAASLETRSEARTFTLSVPAPRGQILDRKGRPLAQSKVAYYAAINLPQILLTLIL